MNPGLFGFPSPAVLGSDNTTTVSSGDKLLRITTFNSSGNWTKLSDVKYVIVWLLGAGGGAGGAKGGGNNGSAGGSGSGGGGCIKKIDATSLLAIEVVTIGAGGAGGASTPTTGYNGGTTSFGAHCSATGGEGGYYVIGTDTLGGGATKGGIGVGGDINFRGQAGNPPMGHYGSYSKSFPGGCGAYPLGGGGAQSVLGTSTNSYNGISAEANTGGGGSGGACLYNNSASTTSGGDGGSGKCVVWEFG